MAQKLSPQATSLYGTPSPLTQYYPRPIIAKRPPTSADIGYPIGQGWVDTVGEDFYGLAAAGGGVASWVLLGATPGEIATLEGDTGGPIQPDGNGNLELIGGDNISTAGASNAITISLTDSVDVAEDVQCRTLFVDGDEGTGIASTVALTNVTDTTQDAGTLSILSGSANDGDNAGFIKVYIGTQVAYIPYFTDIAPA